MLFNVLRLSGLRAGVTVISKQLILNNNEVISVQLPKVGLTIIARKRLIYESGRDCTKGAGFPIQAFTNMKHSIAHGVIFF